MLPKNSCFSCPSFRLAMRNSCETFESNMPNLVHYLQATSNFFFIDNPFPNY